jgi:hypothetical protein
MFCEVLTLQNYLFFLMFFNKFQTNTYDFQTIICFNQDECFSKFEQKYYQSIASVVCFLLKNKTFFNLSIQVESIIFVENQSLI